MTQAAALFAQIAAPASSRQAEMQRRGRTPAEVAHAVMTSRAPRLPSYNTREALAAAYEAESLRRMAAEVGTCTPEADRRMRLEAVLILHRCFGKSGRLPR